MNEFKIIKIQKKDNMSKKNLYKQILSSSKKIKDIINGKKFDYLNNVIINKKIVSLNNDYEKNQHPQLIEKPQQHQQQHQQQHPQLIEKHQQQHPQQPHKKLIEKHQQQLIEKHQQQQQLIEKHQQHPQLIEKNQQQHPHKQHQQQHPQLIEKNQQQHPQLIEKNQQQHPQLLEKQKYKKVTFNIPKKKKSFKSIKCKNDILKNKKSKKKNKLLEIIKLLNKNKYNDSRIYFILKKLDKEFIIDILLALNLIKKRSNAPKKILENIMFSYITSNIIITYK
jgi:hypothetical protein